MFFKTKDSKYTEWRKKWPPLEKMQYFFSGLSFHFKILELCRGGISTYSDQVSLKNVKGAKSFQCFNFKNIKITFWMFFCYYNADFFKFWWFWKEPFAMMALMTTTYLSRCSVWPPPASVHNCSLFPNYYTATHTARQTQDWFTQDCSDFLRKDDWPPNSQDWNPLDFYILGYI